MSWYDEVVKTPDGRVVVTKDGKAVARAVYHDWERPHRWEWTALPEVVADFTLRELAGAAELTLGILDTDIVPANIGMFEEPAYVDRIKYVANQLVIGLALDTRSVFSQFSPQDWQRVLHQWRHISNQLSRSDIPEGFPFDWALADKEVALAKSLGMSIRGQHLLWGADIIESIYSGGYSDDELRRLLEFVVRTRVTKYRDTIAEWHIADSAVTHALFGPRRYRFWYERLGMPIIARVAEWVHDVAPDAVRVIAEGHVLETDKEDFTQIRHRFLALLRYLKRSSAAIDKVGLENNLWIYAVPRAETVHNTLAKIEGLGYQVSSNEMTVNISNVDPLWVNRSTSQTLSNAIGLQASVYRDFLNIFLEHGGDFSIGGLNDGTSWLKSIGHPETQAMIYDMNWRPKPAYFAMVKVLKHRLRPDMWQENAPPQS